MAIDIDIHKILLRHGPKAWRIVFAKSENQPSARLWVAGRNVQGCWGDVWGVFELQIETGDLDFGIGFDTPCHAHGKGRGFN